MLALAVVAASAAAMLAPSSASALVCPTDTRPVVTVHDPLTGEPLGSVCVPTRSPLCELLCLPAR